MVSNNVNPINGIFLNIHLNWMNMDEHILVINLVKRLSAIYTGLLNPTTIGALELCKSFHFFTFLLLVLKFHFNWDMKMSISSFRYYYLA